MGWLSLDSEVEGIVLVVVLDSWDFGAEKRARSFGNFLFRDSDREISTILEHEHEFSTSVFMT